MLNPTQITFCADDRSAPLVTLSDELHEIICEDRDEVDITRRVGGALARDQTRACVEDLHDNRALSMSFGTESNDT